MDQDSAPEPGATGPGADASRGLLQQMEEMMAALNADLSQLDADLQSPAERPPAADRPVAEGHPGSAGDPGSGGTHSGSGSANSRFP